MINWNTEPYNDDFDENSKFHRILFRPSYAVQARELTQLQTILQNQIKRNGDHIFRQGAMVIPGEMSLDIKFHYVKIQPTYGAFSVDSYIAEFEGKRITGSSSGITALVVKVEYSTGTDPTTLYVRYTNSGTDTVTKTFNNDEELTVEGIGTVNTFSTEAIGVGSAAVIKRGVYYINGFYVLCDDQTLLLDKYTNTPTYRVGLTVDEQKIEPEDNESLLDNAQASYNYAAPGAHRYYIDLLLSKLTIDSTNDDNFIELLQVVDGIKKKQISRTEYAEIEKILARRTYDESGDYTVSDFAIDIREHRNNNRGQWTPSTPYLIGDVVTNEGNTYVAKISATSVSIAPVHSSGSVYDGGSSTGVKWEYNKTPRYNLGIYLEGDESKLAIGLEPGKAYIQGYEIEKIAKDYVTIDKARTYVDINNATISTSVGNYALVTNLNNMPDFGTFATVDLYDKITSSRGVLNGTKIGTCRVRGIELDNGTAAAHTAVYKLFVFDVVMNTGKDFSKNVKSFYSSGGSAPLSFTADISPVTTDIAGTYLAATTTITAVGASFKNVVAGDYVYLGSDLRYVVTATDSVLVVDTVPTVVTGPTMQLVRTEIKEPQKSGLVFPYPYYAIRSARTPDNINDNSYTVVEKFPAQTTSGTAGLTLVATSGTFATTDNVTNYLCVSNATGEVVTPTSINSSTGAFQFTSPTYDNVSFTIYAAVNKTGTLLTEKSKTVSTSTLSFTNSAADKALATKQSVSLGKADLIQINSIKMKSGSWTTPGSTYSIDISDRFTIDNGQRDSHYGIAKLNLIASFNVPEAPYEVIFECFTHGVGDYFTRNSYPADIRYEDIDSILRDSIDFRPRIADDGILFSGATASISLIPKRGYDFRSDFSYYLGRKDKIILNLGGVFSSVTGIPALNPSYPENPSISMILYNLSIEPYTFSTNINSVEIGKIDNKRYTMRDIGLLERRIDNLEYYTSLSLLEQQTESLTINDSDGLNRLKNGFIVDPFTSHGIGDAISLDYICSIDEKAAELRPAYSMNNVNMIEKNTGDAGRSGNNYKLYGDVITLPVLDHIKLVEQRYASRVENINPFAIFTFLGRSTINPSSDEWFEVKREADIIQNVEGNYTLLYALAQKTGLFNPVWKGWENTWVGATVATDKVAYNQGSGAAFLNAQFGYKKGAGNSSLRSVVAQNYATEIGQSRTGIKSNVVAKIDTRIIEDKILSTAVIPYIRSRNILIQIKALKPSTRFYPFFDGVDIKEFCTPSTKLIYTSSSPVEFNVDINVGGNSAETARTISGDSQVCLNKGDVLFVSSRSSVAYTTTTSPATAIVIGRDYNLDTGVKTLHLANIKGSFLANDIIQGSVSFSTGTVTSAPSIATKGQELITNFSGEINLIFDIPNTESSRFRTGSKEFKMVDVSTVDGDFSSRARTQYNAVGILQTKQQTVQATRNAELVQEQVSENRTITQSSQRVISDTGWYDPLAQTFLIDCKGGAFLSKVDIFFAHKDTAKPVSLEIREVVNGYPGKRILPFSTVVLNPEDVKLSTNTVVLDEVLVPKYDTPTTFTFPSPVYVEDKTEYCIVLMSPGSTEYKVWISNMGDAIPGSSQTISEQPYAGVLFKSQNASTWTENQDQDLKFTVYRAKFNINVIGDVEFVNDVLPYSNLDKDPIETKSTSNIVRIWHRDHGMPSGSIVQVTDLDAMNITGITGTGTVTTSTSSATVTGSALPVQTLFNTEIGTGTDGAGTVLYSANGTYIGIVQSVTDDTHLTLTANAGVTVAIGTYSIATPLAGIPVTEIYTSKVISNVDLDSYTITTTTSATATGYSGGKTIRASQNIQYDTFYPIAQSQLFSETTIDYSIKMTSGKTVDSSQTGYVLSDFIGCTANETNTLYSPSMVASSVNEINALAGQKSLTFVASLSSTNDALSPIIDTQRLSLIAVSNKVNTPTEANMNVPVLDVDTLISANTTIAFTTATDSVVMSSVDPDTIAILKTIYVGKYVTITGAANAANNKTCLVTAVDSSTGNVTLNIAGYTSAAGSATTVTVRKMFIDEIAPEGSSTHSKYVSKVINLKSPSHVIKTKLSANIPYEASLEVYYKTIGTSAVHDSSLIPWVKFLPEKTIVQVQNGDDTFTDIDYTITDLIAFDAVQIKLVMKSTNSSAVPRVKDLRIIVCA